MRRKMIALALLFAVLLGLGSRAYAAELPDVTKRGSIVILTEFDGEPLEGGALTITRVGQIHTYDGNAGFGLIDALAGGPRLDRLDDPALARELAELAREKGVEGIRAPIEDGRAEFLELEPGLYVVTQPEQDAAEGFAAIQPFLISLPQWVNEDYVYDVTASPKVPLLPEPTEPSEPTEPTEPTDPTEPTEPDPWLPQTGQLNWPVPILAVLGMCFFIAGWILCFRGRREGYDA